MLKKIPNTLTIIRVILAVIVFFLLLGLNYAKRLGIPADWLATIHLVIIVFVSVAAVSDALDGWIARRFNCITVFGKIWDPRADKALTLAYLPLVLLGMINFIPVALLFGRDFHITKLRSQISQPFPARASGKWKTIISFPLMCVLIAIIPVEGNYFLELFRWLHLGFLARFFLDYQGKISLFGGLTLAGFCLWSWIDYFLALQALIAAEAKKPLLSRFAVTMDRPKSD